MNAPELSRTAHGLLEALDFLPVPEGTATLGMEQSVAERFIKAYGADWSEFFLRETPQHTVHVPAFALARYAVTNALYRQFMAAGGYDDPELWTPDGWAWRLQADHRQPRYWDDPRFNGDDLPVAGVSWFEAMAFARWASLLTGENIRLPSEAEWEWAARGDNPKTLYPWGNLWDARKLNSGYSDAKIAARGGLAPVGSYPEGDAPFGHGEMLGQVFEWTNTLFMPYPYDRQDGREDRYTPARRVLRGGNWSDGKYVNRLTVRYHYPPFYADMTTGFRLALGGAQPPIAARPAYDLIVYGRSTFCPDLIDTKRWLHAWNVPYRQLNHDLDEQIAQRLDVWLGSRTVPTIVVAERGEVDPIAPPAAADLKALRNADRGSMLHEPEEATLHAFLVRHGFLSD